ncbi:hypothetical protein, partial [Escherichia coli]|uniref:hypothetical protein n=1 Tax=Escherichia coli TaxID=562 RepID=UPI00197AE12B
TNWKPSLIDSSGLLLLPLWLSSSRITSSELLVLSKSGPVFGAVFSHLHQTFHQLFIASS